MNFKSLSFYLNPYAAITAWLRARAMNVELHLGGMTKAVTRLEKAARLHADHAEGARIVAATLTETAAAHDIAASSASSVASKIKALITP